MDISATIQGKDNFISDATYQSRNPIAGVLVLSEAVVALKTEKDYRARSADFVEATSHAFKLTEDLPAFERVRRRHRSKT